MRKRKVLPLKGPFIDRHVPAVRQLAQRHKIKATDEICEEVGRAVFRFRVFADRDARGMSASDRRKLFAKIAQQAKTLHDQLRALSAELQGEIMPSIELFDDLKMLEVRVGQVTARLEGRTSQRGRKPHDAFRQFVREVHGIYCHATGNDDTFSWNPNTQKLSGGFVKFVKALLPVISMTRKTDAALRGDIAAALPRSS